MRTSVLCKAVSTEVYLCLLRENYELHHLLHSDYLDWIWKLTLRCNLHMQCITYSSGHQTFLAKDHKLCLADRQDLPIEAFREKDCPDCTYNLTFYLA